MAMGTSCPCIYAMLTYGLYERLTLFLKYSVVTRGFLHHFIDDTIRLWYNPTMSLDLTEEDEQKWLENSEKWTEFVADLLLLGLKREAETPSQEVNFLGFIFQRPQRRRSFHNLSEVDEPLLIHPTAFRPPQKLPERARVLNSAALLAAE